MSNKMEYLKTILTSVGGNVDDLPDNLKSTIYTAIILKCGGSVDDLPDNLETTYLKRIAECISSGADYEVGYEVGKKSEYDKFWDTYQENGTKRSYSHCFFNSWNDDIFFPKYDIVPTQMSTCFQYTKITDLKGKLEQQGIKFDTSNCTDFLQAFQGANIQIVPTIDCTKATGQYGISNVFGYFYGHTIEKLILREYHRFYSTFDYARKLENLTIEGTIGQNGLNVQWSPLTYDSLMSIINALKDYSEDTSGTTWKITLGSDNIAKLSGDELNIIYNKGWDYE
jgi:hypothetical protein